MDQFENLKPGLESPLEDAEATTFGVNYTKGATRCLLLAEAGDVEVITLKGTTITLPLQAGYNPIRVLQCVSSALSADKIKGGF